MSPTSYKMGVSTPFAQMGRRVQRRFITRLRSHRQGWSCKTHFRLSLEPTPSPAGYVASPLQNALAGMSWDFGSPLTFLMPLIYFTHRSQVPTSRTSIRTKAWAHVLNRMVSNTDVRAVWSSVCSFFLWGETVAVSAPVIVWDDFLVWLEACCGCGVCFLRFVDAHSKR